MIQNAMKVKDKKTGRTYDCITQAVDLNFDGNYVLRYNIGINGYNEWSFIHAIYDNKEFNEMYEVVNR